MFLSQQYVQKCFCTLLGDFKTILTLTAIRKLQVGENYSYLFNLCLALRMMMFNPYSAGIDFSRRQILTSKIDPRNVRLKLFIMAVNL